MAKSKGRNQRREGKRIAKQATQQAAREALRSRVISGATINALKSVLTSVANVVGEHQPVTIIVNGEEQKVCGTCGNKDVKHPCRTYGSLAGLSEGAEKQIQDVLTHVNGDESDLGPREDDDVPFDIGADDSPITGDDMPVKNDQKRVDVEDILAATASGSIDQDYTIRLLGSIGISEPEVRVRVADYRHATSIEDTVVVPVPDDSVMINGQRIDPNEPHAFSPDNAELPVKSQRCVICTKTKRTKMHVDPDPPYVSGVTG